MLFSVLLSAQSLASSQNTSRWSSGMICAIAARLEQRSAIDTVVQIGSHHRVRLLEPNCRRIGHTWAFAPCTNPSNSISSFIVGHRIAGVSLNEPCNLFMFRVVRPLDGSIITRLSRLTALCTNIQQQLYHVQSTFNSGVI